LALYPILQICSSVESAYALMKGLEIYYNFIRKHEALKNKTPSELATDLEFKSPNRWLELINLATTNQQLSQI